MAAMKTLLALSVILAALPFAAQTVTHSSMGSDASAPNERLGTVSFPVSCARASQAPSTAAWLCCMTSGTKRRRGQFERLAKSDPDAPWRTGEWP